MENKITINVPDGYEIDKENSTFNNIKLKKVEDHKFSKDDIIIDKHGKIFEVRSTIDVAKQYQILDIKTRCNHVFIDYDNCDKDFRKWNINDAKIGDYLYNKKTNTVVIYTHHCEENGILQIYCIVPCDNGYFHSTKMCADPNDIEPSVYRVLFNFLANISKIQHNKS